MKIFVQIVSLILLFSLVASAMPLGTNARTVIPADVMQIISVDYRALRNSDTAMYSFRARGVCLCAQRIFATSC